MNNKITIIITGLICLILGAAGGYYGRGLLRASGPNGQFGVRGAGQNVQLRNAGRFGGQGRAVIGTIQTISGDHLTVQTPDGSSRLVIISSATKYQKMTDAAASDFPVGSSVMVTGAEASDGSVTASSIQAAPARPAASPS